MNKQKIKKNSLLILNLLLIMSVLFVLGFLTFDVGNLNNFFVSKVENSLLENDTKIEIMRNLFLFHLNREKEINNTWNRYCRKLLRSKCN